LSADPVSTHTPTLSLPDALPISADPPGYHPLLTEEDRPGLQNTGVIESISPPASPVPETSRRGSPTGIALVAIAAAMAVLTLLVDRKSTRLNSSHVKISYAVFCL